AQGQGLGPGDVECRVLCPRHGGGICEDGGGHVRDVVPRDPRHTPVTRGPTHDTVVVDPGGQQVEVETGPEEGVSDPRGPDVCFGEEVCTGESEGRCGPGPQE